MTRTWHYTGKDCYTEEGHSLDTTRGEVSWTVDDHNKVSSAN